MPESTPYHLERFYFGNLLVAGKRLSATPGVVARTAGIVPEQVSECLRLAKLIPPSKVEVSPEMPGALALLRGETIDFILVKAQHNDAGNPQMLYILAPVTSLRALGGNVLALRSLAMMSMPSFSELRKDLQPFDLGELAPPTVDVQIDALNTLLLYCQDSFKTVEGILAALVQGWPIAIVNSPPSADLRLRFMQGLLCLLPVPARVGITFATHVNDPTSVAAQIKFMTPRASPAQHLVYDWKNGKLLTPPPQDSYSRYIVTQLRLDVSLVVEQTEELSRTAIWRAMHKESLSRALAWVSRRAAIDRTVREGQPADRELVASILREDPTLTDELRQRYVRHLLAFALALNEPQSVDVVPAVCLTNPSVTQTVVEQLRTAIESKQSLIVYELIERWLVAISEGAELPWQPTLHMAARQHMRALLDQNNIAQAMLFLERLQNAKPILNISEVLPDIVRWGIPTARKHTELAHALFLSAVRALPPGELHRLLLDKEFMGQLPPALQTAAAHLHPASRQTAPASILDQGARVFGPQMNTLVLTRLVECAVFIRRTDLIDTAALQALAVMAHSPQAETFHPLIQQVVEELGQPIVVQTLDPLAQRLLVQLLLEIAIFDAAVALLEFYQNVLFGQERQDEFVRLTRDLFRSVVLSPDSMTEALGHLEGSQIRPEPRVTIYVNALATMQWADSQDYAARRLTTMIFNDNNLVGAVGSDQILRLLDFHARHQNALDALRVGAGLVDYNLHKGMEGATWITRMWPSITWNESVHEAARELLRRFIRGVPPEQVPQLITYFTTQLGPEIGGMLRATDLLNQVMNDVDLLEFAESVQITAQLLVDLATVYHANKELPPKHRLKRDLDTMTGGLSEQERKQVAANILFLTRAVYDLGRDRTRKQGRLPADEALTQTQIVPLNGVDLLRFVGGYFADRTDFPLDLSREEMAHLFGTRSAAMFLRETRVATLVLQSLQQAYERNRNQQITTEILIAELSSLWNSLSLYNQRRIREPFARACQHLADVLAVMSDQANERILADSGIGRQLETGERQPQSSLESLRWIYGYFARKHIRTHT